MIAIDTNVLVYAHREDHDFHAPAARRLSALIDSGQAWAIPWPCVHEFFSVVTHTRVFTEPTPVKTALAAVEAWLASPTLLMLGEDGARPYWPKLRELVASARVVGPMVHDARIAALCLQHGVRELWSADRDFNRFTALKVVNPLIG